MHTEENQPSHKQIHASIATESFFVVCVSNLMCIYNVPKRLFVVCLWKHRRKGGVGPPSQ